MTQNESWNKVRGAKQRKNDEYYTRYEDIDKHFRQFDFTGLHIYCPCDYYGKMGVPYCSIATLDLNQFDIIEQLKDTRVNGKMKFKRVIIQRKDKEEIN